MTWIWYVCIIKIITNTLQTDITMFRRRALFHNTRVTENDKEAAYHLKTGVMNEMMRQEVWLWEKQRISHERGISLKDAEADMKARNWHEPKPKV